MPLITIRPCWAAVSLYIEKTWKTVVIVCFKKSDHQYIITSWAILPMESELCRWTQAGSNPQRAIPADRRFRRNVQRQYVLHALQLY